MPKNKSQLSKTSASASSSSTSSVSSTLFSLKTNIETPKLLELPAVLLDLIGHYLDRKNLIQLAQVNHKAYTTFYPTIKAAMVKVLKALVKQDDTLLVSQLLPGNPNLLLREDKWDPTGKAYKGIETTPYQDTLADVMQEEMRTLLEESFPSEAKEEEHAKKEKLSFAAIQAEEFKQPRFDQLRYEKRIIMEERTTFAYETYKNRVNAWAATKYNNAHVQRVRDAWMRVGLVQNQWPKRLRKIFSVVNMDEKQTFENLPRDIPEPHFHARPYIFWLPGTVQGCDLQLMSVPEDQDLSEADFRANLRTIADGYPALIRRGEGEKATYHLYAPYIPLDRDESEWRVVPIDDPVVIELITRGKSPPYSDMEEAAVDFNQQTFFYNSVFNELYCFGDQHSLHLGSGYPYIFATYNYWRDGRKEVAEAVRSGARGRPVGVANERNFAAVTALYKKRAERLARHLVDLRDYLPAQPLNLPSPLSLK